MATVTRERRQEEIGGKTKDARKDPKEILREGRTGRRVEEVVVATLLL